jgi:hypothetical protein
MFPWNYNWQCFTELLDDLGSRVKIWPPRNQKACFGKLHTMYGAHQSAGFRCIHWQLGVTSRLPSCAADEQYEQFREIERREIVKSKRLWKKGNGRNNKVSAMKRCFGKTVQTVCITRILEHTETDLCRAVNVGWIDYTEFWLAIGWYWLVKTNVHITVLSIRNVHALWHSTLELLELANQFQPFTKEWLKNPNNSQYWPLSTTQDVYTIVKFMMEVLGPFHYRTFWMSNWPTVILHHDLTVYSDIFDHIDGLMWALGKQKTQWNKDIYWHRKCVR